MTIEGGRSHGPALMAEELGMQMDAPPTIDGGWEVQTVAQNFRQTPVGLREASALHRRIDPQTGRVEYELHSVIFGNGDPREFRQRLTPDELFRRIRI